MATETLRPNGVGSNTNLTNVGGTTNWGNNADDDDATAVSAESSGYVLDTYAVADTAIPAGSIINKVSVKMRVKADSSYRASAKPALKSGATVYYGTSRALTTSWAEYTHDWTSNPADSESWGVSDLDGLEAGVALGQGSTLAYCASIWMIVDYSLVSGGRACQVIMI